MENDSEMRPRCLICSGSGSFWMKKNEYNLYKCRDCGLIFVHPLPENFADIYSTDYFTGAKSGFGYVDYESDKNATLATLKLYLKKIEKLVPGKGQLLDVGAATGNFLEVAVRHGWQVGGVEISGYAAEKARQKNLDVRTGKLEDSKYEESSFNAITLWDVLEHLENPEGTLRLVCALLKPGGVIAINTPNSGSTFAKLMGGHWHLMVPPEHLVYFNANNLSRLLSGIGFEVCEVTSVGKKFTLQYIFKTLARWQKFSLWQWMADKLQNTSLGRLSVPINLHDNVFIVAKKT